MDIPDLLKFKYQYLRSLQGKGEGDGSRGKIGIPFGLNMYENLPFWFTLFTTLNFEVVLSPESTRKPVPQGAAAPSPLTRSVTLPSSSTATCMALLEEGVDAIFYPCMSYNFDEQLSATTTITVPWWPTIPSCWRPTSPPWRTSNTSIPTWACTGPRILRRRAPSCWRPSLGFPSGRCCQGHPQGLRRLRGLPPAGAEEG